MAATPPTAVLLAWAPQVPLPRVPAGLIPSRATLLPAYQEISFLPPSWATASRLAAPQVTGRQTLNWEEALWEKCGGRGQGWRHLATSWRPVSPVGRLLGTPHGDEDTVESGLSRACRTGWHHAGHSAQPGRTPGRGQPGALSPGNASLSFSPSTLPPSPFLCAPLLLP